MLNILSCIGMDLQMELCLWTVLGLLRSIFDASVFKVNANLKQVWQMRLPAEFSLPVQSAFRTMISGVMLVQCFTLYVYIATYIVLLYPVLVEERPTLVLPWLLIAAIRKFLCELMSLALGLAACILLGPTRPACIKFVVYKVLSVTPAVYLWTMVFSYYHVLKMATTFQNATAVVVQTDTLDLDDGLELAVRRRRTKSLLPEELLRKKLVADLGGSNFMKDFTTSTGHQNSILLSNQINQEDNNKDQKHDNENKEDENENKEDENESKEENTIDSPDPYSCEELLFGRGLVVPRNADRILEQLVIMLLQISFFKDSSNITDIDKLFSSSTKGLASFNNEGLVGSSLHEETDIRPSGNSTSYLEEYPQIFKKKGKKSHTLQNKLTSTENIQVDSKEIIIAPDQEEGLRLSKESKKESKTHVFHQECQTSTSVDNETKR